MKTTSTCCCFYTNEKGLVRSTWISTAYPWGPFSQKTVKLHPADRKISYLKSSKLQIRQSRRLHKRSLRALCVVACICKLPTHCEYSRNTRVEVRLVICLLQTRTDQLQIEQNGKITLSIPRRQLCSSFATIIPLILNRSPDSYLLHKALLHALSLATVGFWSKRKQ